MEDLPAEAQEVMEFGMTMQKFPGHVELPISSKLTEKHIDKVLDLAKDDSDKDYKANLWDMGMRISIFFMAIGLFVFLTFFLVKRTKHYIWIW